MNGSRFYGLRKSALCFYISNLNLTRSSLLSFKLVIGGNMDVVLVSAVESSSTVGAGVNKGVGEMERLHMVLGVMLLLELLQTELAGEADHPTLRELFQKGLVLGNAWEQRGANDKKRAVHKQQTGGITSKNYHPCKCNILGYTVLKQQRDS